VLLQRGDLEGAMRGYRGELAARGPEQPFLVERILSIASASREYFIDGLELARQVLGRWPDFAPAHAAIASIAVAQGDVESSASRYRDLSQASAASGDEEGTVRAALAGARLLRQFAPDDSTKLFELVLEHRPGHAESAEALADRYRDEKRYSDLVRLIRMRLSTTDDPQRRARDHARLAEVLVDRLSSPELALAELVAACRLDESIPGVYEQRAEVELALGHLDDALASLEAANSLHGQRNDFRSRTRNLIRGGQACLEAKQYDTAEAWFQAALELSLGNSLAMRGAAQAATGLGQHQEAARLWRELFDAGVEAPRVQAHFACELGRALLANGNFADAKAALERATTTGSASTRAEARAALATMSVRDENATEALDHLRIAIDELDCSDDEDDDESASGMESSMHRIRRGAELSLERAQIALFENQLEDAMFDLRRAFDYAMPGDEIRKDAARMLLQYSGSTEGELAWVDELSAGNPDG
jgi:tetratricopeptide (TPR) repeat protein